MKKNILVFLTLALSTVSLWALDFSELSLELKNYYVTEDGTDDGDGSSWKKAIGNEAFAYLLPRVKKGATFHLAAGTYTPVYDSDMEIPSDKRWACFYINKSVSIIGGYVKESDGNYEKSSLSFSRIMADRSNNDLWIEGDKLANIDDDLHRAMLLSLSESDECTLKGLEFYGGTTGINHYFHATLEIEKKGDLGVNDEKPKVIVDSCVFKNCYKAISITDCNAMIQRCSYDECVGAFQWVMGDINVESCTFYNTSMNATLASLYVYHVPNASHMRIVNSTIYANKSRYIIWGGINGSDWTFVNNTIAGRDLTVTLNFSDCTMNWVGNILLTNSITIENILDEDQFTSQYNIFKSNDSTYKKYTSSTDIKTEDESFITWKLDDNGVLTKTLKLKYDEADLDGENKILRFPTYEGVTVDQRGVERSRKACIGAYEIPCKKDSLNYSVKDTINRGGQYDGKQYEIPGVYEMIHVYENRYGCDSLVPCELYVMPSPNVKKYYVKEKGAGKGDGSSWANAMSAESFGRFICLSGDDVTFHIAEGVYHPNFKTSRGLYEYSHEGSLRIIGGYPNDIQDENQMPMPELHKTIFSADYNDDDELKEDYSLPEASDSYSTNYYTNTDENGHSLLYVTLNENDSLYVYGVTFRGTVAGYRISGQAVSVYNTVYSNEKRSGYATIERCVFDGNQYGLYDAIDCRTINCSFMYCLYDIHCSSEDFILENSYLGDSYYGFYSNYLGKLKIQNSTFANIRENITRAYLDTVNTMLLYNNTFVSSDNKSEISINEGNACQMIGNVFAMNKLDFREHYEKVNPGKYISKYNLYSCGFKGKEERDIVSETDVKTIQYDLSGVLSGTYDSKSDMFTPYVSTNGYTYYVEMIRDSIGDKSLRFPLDETVVSVDQRGVTRLDSTCVGAYEINNMDTRMRLPENIPTIFTPSNVNGKNDIFLKGYEVYVYNLYGSLICHSLDGWNGMYNDAWATTGTYIYVVVCGEEKRMGTISVVR